MISLRQMLPSFMRRAKPTPTVTTPKPIDRGQVQASYDAARNGSLTENAWIYADTLSADEANNPAVRQELRRRSRYECLEANSYLKGAIHTIAQDMIGRGPRLQMQLTGEDARWNSSIEADWLRWSRATHFAKTLRTLTIATYVDGEDFSLFTTSRTIPGDLPQLFLRAIEADRCTTPGGTSMIGPRQVDGLKIDEAGEVVAYYLYDEISPWKLGTPTEYDASMVCHHFRQDRPGQHRGIPIGTTSLPLCSLLRDYTLSCVSAARTAAKHTVLLQTNGSVVRSEEDPPIEDFSSCDIDYDMQTILPKGYSASQMKAEHPTTTYEMFRDCLLGEIVRPFGAPLNIVLGSSQKWNYASTQADQVSYALKLDIEHEERETTTVDPTFAHWWREMQLLGKAPLHISAKDATHQWFWDRRKDADPQTMATTRDIELRNGTTNRAAVLAQQSVDIDAHDEIAAASLGISKAQYRQIIARALHGDATVDGVLASTGGTSPIAMNGAQIQGITAILAQVGSGAISPAPARALAAAAFPALSEQQLLAIFPDAPPPPKVATPAGVAAPDRRSGGLPVEAKAQ